MIFYPTVDGLIAMLESAFGPQEVRDRGLLESAVARPKATGYGEDAYPSLHDKAAALLHSLAKNHGLVDGNKRIAVFGFKAMLNMNGWDVVADDHDIYNLIMDVSTGVLDEIPKIAEQLHEISRPMPFPPDLLPG